MSPEVSIIIPVYNAEKYLFECLDSIRNQKFINFEVLIIDDGSIDGSRKIISEFVKMDLRFNYFYQDNQGVSTARNNGLKNVNGEYIIFIDSDDKCEPNYIHGLVQGLNQQYDFVSSGYTFYNQENKSIERRIPKRLGEISKSEFLMAVLNELSVYSFLWNKIFRMSIINEFFLKFDETISYGEDLLFIIIYLKNSESCFIIGEANYVYRRHESSTTSNITNKGLRSKLTFLDAMDKSLKILPQDLNKEITELRKKYCNVGVTFYRLTIRLGFPKVERKNLKTKIKSNYSIIRRDLGLRSIIKYYACMFFPRLTNFIISRIRK